MDVPGFTLRLQKFCSYCPDFEAVVDKYECTNLRMGGIPKSKYSIYCKNQGRCARIVENLKEKCEHERV